MTAKQKKTARPTKIPAVVYGIMTPDGVYVGATMKPLEHSVTLRDGRYRTARIAAHRAMLRAGEHHARALQASYDKHGPDCLLIVVLETLPTTLRSARTQAEQRWMDHYRATGVQVLNGSSSACGRDKGWHHSPAAKAEMSRAGRTRNQAVEQLHPKTGQVLAVHRDRRAAARAVRGRAPVISRCVRGVRGVAYGYRWRTAL